MDNDNSNDDQSFTPPEPSEPKPEQQGQTAPSLPPDEQQPHDSLSQDQTPLLQIKDYNKNAEAYRASHKRRWPYGKIIIALLIIIIVSGAVYWFFIKAKPVAKKTPSKTSSSQSQKPASTPKASQSTSNGQIDSSTKHYDSSSFKLGFDYPADWTVSDPGAGILTVTSPALQLTDTSGQSVTGQVVMTIRDKNQLLPEFDKGSAAAVLKSVQITYTKPTGTQIDVHQLFTICFHNNARSA
jgi:cytoskeletal protein RodZ